MRFHLFQIKTVIVAASLLLVLVLFSVSTTNKTSLQDDVFVQVSKLFKGGTSMSLASIRQGLADYFTSVSPGGRMDFNTYLETSKHREQVDRMALGLKEPNVAPEIIARVESMKKNGLITNFHRVDVNHDGYLSLEEFQELFIELENADENHDGVLTAEELRADLKQVLAPVNKLTGELNKSIDEINKIGQSLRGASSESESTHNN
jgi:hypothetical protein